MAIKLGPKDADTLQNLLVNFKDCEHLRVRARVDLLTLESGEQKNAVSHIRFRKVSAKSWLLECATHTSRWEPTPFTGSLTKLMSLVVETLPWTIASFD
jgi:hypothetical protein